jgi:hypothetical protein
MRTRIAIVVTLLGSGLYAETASATYAKEFPPSLCVAQSGKPAVSISADGQASSASSSIWFCPVDRDSLNPFINPTQTAAVVNFWSGGAGTVTVRSCRASATGGSIVCDATQNSGAAGLSSITWNPGSAWKSSNLVDSLYISVTVAGPGLTVFGYAALD